MAAHAQLLQHFSKQPAVGQAHHLSRLMFATCELLANPPREAAMSSTEFAETLARSAFPIHVLVLLQDGLSLSFIGMRALLLCLCASQHTHAPLANADLVEAVLGALRLRDPLLRPVAAQCLQLWSCGPSREKVMNALMESPGSHHHLVSLLSMAQLRSSGQQILSSILRCGNGRRWCRLHQDVLENFLVGSTLESQWRSM